MKLWYPVNKEVAVSSGPETAAAAWQLLDGPGGGGDGGGLQQLDCQPLLQGGGEGEGRSAGRGLALVLGCCFDAPRTCLLLSSRLSTGDAGRINAAGRLSSNSCVAETVAVVSFSLLLLVSCIMCKDG